MNGNLLNNRIFLSGVLVVFFCLLLMINYVN
jgi:hypothetical protein